MSITLLDGILIVVMLISALLAMIRGFVREVLSIAAWVAAAAAAFLLYDDVLPYVQPHIAQKQLALVASAGGVFVLTLIIVSFITMRISDYVLDSRIGPLDRTLGFVFGAARGLLLVVVGMLFFNWFIHDEASQPAWVAQAKSRPLLNALGAQLMAALPEDPEKQILDQFQNPSVDDGSGLPDSEETQPPADDAAPGDAAPGGAAPGVAPDDGAYRPGEQNGLDQLIQSTATPKP